MCLLVTESFVKEPIYEEECVKVLFYDGAREKWCTPYRYNDVPTDGTGWFMPKRLSRRVSTFSRNAMIEGGFIHAYRQGGVQCVRGEILTELPECAKAYKRYAFKAVARYVVAHGAGSELACKAIYIPAFDATGLHRNAELILD